MSNTKIAKADSRERRRQLANQLANPKATQAKSGSGKDFARHLYPIPDHLRALDPEVVLIVGPRGAGKSTLLRAFFSDDLPPEALSEYLPPSPSPKSPNRLPDGTTLWKVAYPSQSRSHFPDLPNLPDFPDFPNSRVLAREIDSGQRARDLWYVMLVRRLFGKSNEFDDESRDALGPILKPQANQLAEIFRALETIAINPTTALDKLDQRLEREDRWLFVGYDDLHTLAPLDWSHMARLTGGLLSFWADYGRRWRQIRAKIVLPSELLYRHGGSGSADLAKLSASRIELFWSDDDLLAMLVKRIANTSDELLDDCTKARIGFRKDEVLGAMPMLRHRGAEEGQRLLKRLVGTSMDTRRKSGPVWSWILDHLRDANRRIAPNTLIHLIACAASMEVNDALRPPRLIHPTALRQALPRVSKAHVEHAIDSEWPWLEGLRTRLNAHARSVPIWKIQKRRDLEDLLARQWEGDWGHGDPQMTIGPPQDTPSALVEHLMELGIVRSRAGDRIDIPHPYRSGLILHGKSEKSEKNEKSDRCR